MTKSRPGWVLEREIAKDLHIALQVEAWANVTVRILRADPTSENGRERAAALRRAWLAIYASSGSPKVYPLHFVKGVLRQYADAFAAARASDGFDLDARARDLAELAIDAIRSVLEKEPNDTLSVETVAAAIRAHANKPGRHKAGSAPILRADEAAARVYAEMKIAATSEAARKQQQRAPKRS